MRADAACRQRQGTGHLQPPLPPPGLGASHVRSAAFIEITAAALINPVYQTHDDGLPTPNLLNHCNSSEKKAFEAQWLAPMVGKPGEWVMNCPPSALGEQSCWWGPT